MDDAMSLLGGSLGCEFLLHLFARLLLHGYYTCMLYGARATSLSHMCYIFYNGRCSMFVMC